MLDDLKFIHQKDAQDALGIAEKQPQQYIHPFQFEFQADDWKPTNVVVAGMGGSALAAIAIKNVPGISMPFEIVRDYELPSFVSQNTLLICSSYSGNTEETLSVVTQALHLEETKRPRMVLISSGGKLQEIAAEHHLSFIGLPIGFQPRHTFGFQYAALSQLFRRVGIMQEMYPPLDLSVESLKEAIAAWRPDVATKDNLAKQIAQEVMGRSVVIYAGPKLFPAAYKWKISFNENAKTVAWCNQYPEFNHNEFIGWSSHPIDKPYAVIDLRSQFENSRVLKRFELSAKLLSGLRPAPIVVDIPKGTTILEDMMWAIALGDFVTLYVALLNGLNPTPVDLIEKFKKELGS
jgi:glucose/mannose-6-phosphate isomerase